MASIVLCHLLQAYDNRWAWIFNVGVQIFLAISGWLYGNKDVVNWQSWYKDKLRKLYLPYVIYIVFIFLVYRLFNVDIFLFKNLIIYLLDLQWIFGGVDGISHFWFMTAIALCYISTPLLQKIKEKGYVSISLLVLSIIGLLNFLLFDFLLVYFSCLFVYSFCYLFACVKSNLKRIYALSLLGGFIYILTILKWDIILDYTNVINK